MSEMSYQVTIKPCESPLQTTRINNKSFYMAEPKLFKSTCQSDCLKNANLHLLPLLSTPMPFTKPKDCRRQDKQLPDSLVSDTKTKDGKAS